MAIKTNEDNAIQVENWIASRLQKRECCPNWLIAYSVVAKIGHYKLHNLKTREQNDKTEH